MCVRVRLFMHEDALSNWGYADKDTRSLHLENLGFAATVFSGGNLANPS